MKRSISSRHLELDLSVDFEARQVAGWVMHELAASAGAGDTLELDVRGIQIEAIEGAHDSDFSLRRYRCGRSHNELGSRLRVNLRAKDRRIRIRYRSSPEASGLQWLRPEQSLSGTPYLYSQGQTVHTRSWIPCFDAPSLRTTYAATIRVPVGLRALMAAPRRQELEPGVFRFEMPYPIPSYLIALAVGNFVSVEVSPRCAVFCEAPLLAAAAYEFAETEQMLRICEGLFGPYRWERYDLLILPPSAPLGGMENPTLTFVTPTLLAGDRSLVAVIAHELAHSWSGNLVCNASWGDFWLNEGFTVYVERRILERLYGRQRAALEAAIGFSRLQSSLQALASQPERTRLAQPEPELHPDHAITDVPYEKGYLFLRRVEQVLGRREMNHLLRHWFDEGAFLARSSEQFRRFLAQRLRKHRRARELDLTEWLFGTGLPADAPKIRSDRADELREGAESFGAGLPNFRAMQRFEPLEWIYFLRCLRDAPRSPEPEALRRLGERFHLDSSRNPELLSNWLAVSLKAGRLELLPRAREFLLCTGRNKLIAPVYEALLAQTNAAESARDIYREARPRYHDMVHTWLDEKLGFSAAE